MTVIDTFLTLLVNQKADRLLVTPGDVPTLFKEDETMRLSMPAVSAEMVGVFALEVIGRSRADELIDGARIEGVYRTAAGDAFDYRVHAKAAGCEIDMRPFADTSPDEAENVPDDQKTATLPEEDERVMTAVKSAIDAQKAGIKSVPAQLTRKRRDGPPRTPAPERALLGVLKEALRFGASDVFLSSNKPPRTRVDGSIMSVDAAVTPEEWIAALLPSEREEAMLKESGSADFGVTWSLPGSHGTTKAHRFRINIFRHASGLGAAIRPVNTRVPSLEELNLPKDLYGLCDYPSGLVLFTGASGSGKSTTLAALVEHINQTRARHIITIEDPIEFQHESRKSLIHQREVGTHVKSFSVGLRAALRENPDVILLGEMRDPPTISAALTASETGHLVFSTLHTGNAASAISRIIDGFPGHQQAHVRLQVAGSLRAVVAEQLIASDITRGRLPALEKLVVTHAVSTQIREGREHQLQSAIQTGGDDGMVTLERSLAALVRSGHIRRGTALKHAEDPHALRKLLDG
jgi:twitching motility protein PilT